MSLLAHLWPAPSILLACVWHPGAQLHWGREPAQLTPFIKRKKFNCWLSNSVCGKLDPVPLASPPDSALASVFTGLEASPLSPSWPFRVQAVAGVGSLPVLTPLVSENLVLLSCKRESADVAQDKTVNLSKTCLDCFCDVRCVCVCASVHAHVFGTGHLLPLFPSMHSETGPLTKPGAQAVFLCPSSLVL